MKTLKLTGICIATALSVLFNLKENFEELGVSNYVLFE
jgi:hypothetical protein